MFAVAEQFNLFNLTLKENKNVNKGIKNIKVHLLSLV